MTTHPNAHRHPAVGIGLPIHPDTPVTEWARRAERGPYSSVGLVDRLTFDNPEPLVTLAAVAGATERLRLRTQVLLTPLRETALLAKQAATLDRISGGRLSIGVGVGVREDDYAAAGVAMHERGRLLDEQLERLRRIWACGPDGEGIGPAPVSPGGPELLFGGFSPAVARRVATWGDGYVSAAPPEYTARAVDGVLRQWKDAGRTGRPTLVAQANVALGSADVVAQAAAALSGYYAFLDDSPKPGLRSEHVVAGLLRTPDAVADAVADFGAAGVDEVVLFCWAPDPAQVEAVAEALAC